MSANGLVSPDAFEIQVLEIIANQAGTPHNRDYVGTPHSRDTTQPDNISRRKARDRTHLPPSPLTKGIADNTDMDAGLDAGQHSAGVIHDTETEGLRQNTTIPQSIMSADTNTDTGAGGLPPVGESHRESESESERGSRSDTPSVPHTPLPRRSRVRVSAKNDLFGMIQGAYQGGEKISKSLCGVMELALTILRPSAPSRTSPYHHQ